MFNEALVQKWRPVLELEGLPEINDPVRLSATAQLLENQHLDNIGALEGSGGYNAPGSLMEDAPSNQMGASATFGGNGNVDIYDPVLISLVRRAMPNLIAYDVVGVQPMSGPVGLIFAMRSRYDSQTSAEALFNEADTDFAATAQGNNAHQTANSQYVAQTGTSPAVNPTGAEYTAQGGFNTPFAEKLGDDVGNRFQEMAFSIEKIAVEAKSRALRADYTIELAQDLKSIHGLDAEAELANILSAEILAEINREVIRMIYVSSTLGAQENVQTAGTFNLDVDADGRWSVEKFKGLMFQIEREANQIAKATRRGKGNVVLCSSDVASALQMTGVLDSNHKLANNLTVDDTGNTFVGVLNGRYRVYIDPYFLSAGGEQFATVGYKGSSVTDAGMFYCPYVPLQMVRAVGEHSFQPKIGFKTRYGLVANPFATTAADGVVSFSNKNKYYRKFSITNLL